MTNIKNHYDAIILGAGGAGLMCAAVAGQRGRRILLIDHADRPGKKILISGGGRCNFTNSNTAADRYLSNNKHFAKSALSRFKPQDFIDLVNKYGIRWHEKTLGQLFCDGPAIQIVDMLLDECAMGNVEYQFGDSIRDVSRKEDGSYEVSVGGRTVTSASVVIATGGPSIPKMGATAYAYDLARQFGLKVVEPRPALVPLTLGGDETLFRELSGVATEVVARSGKTEFREAALFTHKGLSGPAILQVSSYWRKGEEIGINFLPDKEKGWLLEAKRTNSAQAFKTVIGNLLPARLAETLVERIGFSHELNNISDKKLVDAEQRLANWRFTPNGSEGLAKAEVTAGGISTDGLSSQTMEAKKMPGLYAIGEAVDVTGWLGGYNFQWAWASAWAAGQVL